jgi:hypothetical protein
MKRKNKTTPRWIQAAHEAINAGRDEDDEVIIKTYSKTLSYDAALKALPKFMHGMGERWVREIITAYILKGGANPRTGSMKLSKYVRTIVDRLYENPELAK